MKKPGKRLIAILAAGAAAIVAVTTVRAMEESVAMNDLPDAVQKALKEAVGDGAIGEIEREKEDGRIVYEAEATIDGRRVELEFSADGVLLETEPADDGDDEETEESIALDKLPAAVQTALSQRIPGVQVDEVEKEVEGGHVYYEVEYEANDTEQTLKLTEQGDIVETETEVDAAALPAGVTEYLQARYAGARIDEAELVTVQYYEIELESGNRDVEVQLLANGQAIELENDDD